jgi:hypothetical protein
MKMFVSDYQELVRGRSEKRPLAFSVKVDNVEHLPGSRNCFTHIASNCYSHHLGAFDRGNRYFMNYHWRVFRAQDTIARLTVSDWAGDDGPGGPPAQELMFNFIEIQPWYE